VISLLLATARAESPTAEVSFEMTSIANHDPAYDLFHEEDGMGLPGVRLGYRVHPRVAVVGAWGALRTGARAYTGSYTTTSTYGYDTSTTGGSGQYVAAMTAHQARLGLRADVPIGRDVLLPAVSASAVALPTRWRFDGDPSVNDPVSQVSASGVPVGFEATGGAELRVPTRGTWTAAVFLDLGGTWLSRAAFGAIGEMKPGGFTAHGGVGLRF
jgi:hypothetical protein